MTSFLMIFRDELGGQKDERFNGFCSVVIFGPEVYSAGSFWSTVFYSSSLKFLSRYTTNNTMLASIFHREMLPPISTRALIIFEDQPPDGHF